MFPTITDVIESKKGRQQIYHNGFHMMGGIVTALVINELWEHLKLPGWDKKPITESLINKQPIQNSNVSNDMLWKIALWGSVMLSEFAGVKGGFISGVGMLIGFSWADRASSGKYIGQI